MKSLCDELCNLDLEVEFNLYTRVLAKMYIVCEKDIINNRLNSYLLHAFRFCVSSVASSQIEINIICKLK